MGVRVVSKRVGGTKPVAGETVIDISRTSVLGNDSHMSHESQRQHVIEDFRVILVKHYRANDSVWAVVKKLAARVKAGENLALECWCAPRACHGDVIVKAIEFINNGEVE